MVDSKLFMLWWKSCTIWNYKNEASANVNAINNEVRGECFKYMQGLQIIIYGVNNATDSFATLTS